MNFEEKGGKDLTRKVSSAREAKPYPKQADLSHSEYAKPRGKFHSQRKRAGEAVFEARGDLPHYDYCPLLFAARLQFVTNLENDENRQR